MPSLKKYFSFTDKNQIWRLLISETDKLVIETRDTTNKQAYFSCVDLVTGKPIFKKIQMEEKFWLGIEDVADDIILFHGFVKPDLPQHKGITAFSVINKKVLWRNEELNFFFASGEKVFACLNKFESKEFYLLNLSDGKIIKELGNNPEEINSIKIQNQKDYSDYSFPEITASNDNRVNIILDEIKEENIISGNIYFTEKEGLLFLNFHSAADNGTFTNQLKVLEITNKKVIFEEVLSKNKKQLTPDSFFLKNNHLFLLKEKENLVVYKIKK